MLVNRFCVPQHELSDVGLAEINMSRLGKYVALTGKNGAGKTRVLTKLINYMAERNALMPNLEQSIRNIADHVQAIKNNPHDHVNIINWQNFIDSTTHSLMRGTERVFTASSEVINPIYFVPKQLNLVDARVQNKQTMMSYFNAAKNPGIQGLESTCFSYMQQIQNREWAASHQRSTHTNKEKDDARSEYERLVSIIESLLKTKIDRSIDDDLTIFGKPIAEAGLSDGQKILIQLAAALHAQKASLKNSIFIMDEPENHLHPSALIEFLDALSQIAENSQFWISTHSVPLLAHIAQTEPASIWYVEDGIVSNAGTNPLKVLKGLLGDDNQIDALNNFTSLPAQFALINHAVECLSPPAVAENRSGDPQVAQINQVLNATIDGAKMAVLDFGSGKSRLISGLHELAIAQSLDITNSVEYFAFDPLPYDNEIGKGVISDIYKDNSQRHFSTLEEFFSIKDEASIDVVVMCNVLHEINPNEWLTTFNAQSLIGRALKDTGHVLIVEDQRIPNGEKAHQFGFLVLDTPHIKTLFKIVEKDISEGKFKYSDFREDGRLKAHLISKYLLSRIDANSRTKAITELVTTAKAHIKNCRESAPSYKTGQLHGFWTQQFANACLYLDQQ